LLVNYVNYRSSKIQIREKTSSTDTIVFLMKVI